jgi:hypothetical protein
MVESKCKFRDVAEFDLVSLVAVPIFRDVVHMVNLIGGDWSHSAGI